MMPFYYLHYVEGYRGEAPYTPIIQPKPILLRADTIVRIDPLIKDPRSGVMVGDIYTDWQLGRGLNGGVNRITLPEEDYNYLLKEIHELIYDRKDSDGRWLYSGKFIESLNHKESEDVSGD